MANHETTRSASGLAKSPTRQSRYGDGAASPDKTPRSAVASLERGGVRGFLGRLLLGVKKHPPARRPESDIEAKRDQARHGVAQRSRERERLMAGDAELEMAMRAAAAGGTDHTPLTRLETYVPKARIQSRTSTGLRPRL